MERGIRIVSLSNALQTVNGCIRVPDAWTLSALHGCDSLVVSDSREDAAGCVQYRVKNRRHSFGPINMVPYAVDLTHTPTTQRLQPHAIESSTRKFSNSHASEMHACLHHRFSFDDNTALIAPRTSMQQRLQLSAARNMTFDGDVREVPSSSLASNLSLRDECIDSANEHTPSSSVVLIACQPARNASLHANDQFQSKTAPLSVPRACDVEPWWIQEKRAQMLATGPRNHAAHNICDKIGGGDAASGFTTCHSRRGRRCDSIGRPCIVNDGLHRSVTCTTATTALHDAGDSHAHSRSTDTTHRAVKGAIARPPGHINPWAAVDAASRGGDDVAFQTAFNELRRSSCMLKRGPDCTAPSAVTCVPGTASAVALRESAAELRIANGGDGTRPQPKRWTAAVLEHTLAIAGATRSSVGGLMVSLLLDQASTYAPIPAHVTASSGRVRRLPLVGNHDLPDFYGRGSSASWSRVAEARKVRYGNALDDENVALYSSFSTNRVFVDPRPALAARLQRVVRDSTASRNKPPKLVSAYSVAPLGSEPEFCQRRYVVGPTT